MTSRTHGRSFKSRGKRKPELLANSMVKAISAVHPTAKGPKGVLEQEIVFRKKFLSLDETNRFKITNALASSESNDLARRLIANILYYDSSPLVRHEAAFALGWIGDKTTEEILVHALLGDQSFLVRHEAAMALGELGFKSSLEALRKGLRDKTGEVAVSCKVAIQRIRETPKRQHDQ